MTASDSIVIRGQLFPFSETGTEGVVWALTADGVPGYDNLFTLSDGDELLAYGPDGSIAWQVVVSLEYERRFRPYPLNPQHGQQEIMGAWVHGFQRDLRPHQWAKPFFQEAPAVARMKPRQFGNDPVLSQALGLLETDALDAWAFLQQADKALFGRIDQSLDYAWSYACQRLKWTAQPLNTPEDRADAWQLLLALAHARRALWAPGADTDHLLAQRWPSRSALSAVERQHWLQHALPSDDVFSSASCGSSIALPPKVQLSPTFPG
jgi:hypothetical protein